MAADEAPQLSLQPGDLLEVRVDSATTSVAHATVVEADGTMFVPGVGTVRAQGRSVGETEQAATELLRTSDRFAQVHVVLRERAGQRVTVLGAVVRQGTITLLPGMRVADVIAAAGGVLSMRSSVDNTRLPLGDLASAVVVRDGRPLPIDLGLALRGHPAHNVHAHPGDHIYVPMAQDSSVRVMGQVGSPIVFALVPGLRLTQALTRAGGIAVGGDKSDVRLVRGAVEEPVVFSADVAAIVDGDAPDVEIAAGDLLFVTDDPVEDIGEVVGIIAPILATASAAAFTLLLTY